MARWDSGKALAMFEQLGGDEARSAAESFWRHPTDEARAVYLHVCGPLYTQSPGNMFEAVEMIRNPQVFTFWNDGEHKRFDLRRDLAKAACPVLVLGGELDPVCPIEGSVEIVEHIPKHLVQFERFERCGHGVFRDNPERAFEILRDFVTS